MSYIDEQLLQFKTMIEDSIIEGGAKGKESAIRSSALIGPMSILWTQKVEHFLSA